MPEEPERAPPNQPTPLGVVFNVQRCSVHDGPGIRTTAFLKGCPLSCSWCHNPEGIDAVPRLMLAGDRCVSCGACIDACPDHLARESSTAEAPPRRCRACGACVDACPADARWVVGREVGAQELVDELARDRPFFEASGGGVTFSGGEPLAQAGFLAACLRECRRQRLHTAVDTCGLAPRAQLLEVAVLSDLVLYDLKHMDPARHRELTGRGNRAILDNLRALSEAGSEIWVRVPVVAGVNDDPDTLDAMAAFLGALPRRHPVFLLPLHDLGRAKAVRLGAAGAGAGFQASGSDRLAAARERLLAADLEVAVGGSP